MARFQLTIGAVTTPDKLKWNVLKISSAELLERAFWV